MIAGLTGGIGSGKTTVARIFSILGCAVFYSDEAAKLAYFRDDVRKGVTELLGKNAYEDGHAINRQYIGSRIFSNARLREQLNSLIHPAVGNMFRQFVASHPNKLIIKESALLYEADVTAELHQVIVVAAPDETRISRVMKRDGLSREEVVRKLSSQIPQEEKIRMADHVIHNNDGLLLIPQVERIFVMLTSHDQERLSRSPV